MSDNVPTTCAFTLRVINSGADASSWTNFTTTVAQPAGTSVSFDVRTSTANLTWPDWTLVTSNDINLAGRYAEIDLGGANHACWYRLASRWNIWSGSVSKYLRLQIDQTPEAFLADSPLSSWFNDIRHSIVVRMMIECLVFSSPRVQQAREFDHYEINVYGACSASTRF